MLSPKIFFQRLDGADFVTELAQASINYQEGMVSVAFARRNGADIICNKILNNKKVLFFIGINNGVTSKQALEYLIDQNVHQDIYLVNTGSSQQIFHPKVFCFYDATSKKGVLSLGSSNLTSGGFEKNIEANILLYIDSTNWDLIETIAINLNSIKADCIHLKSKTQLNDLLDDGFLEDETKKSFVEARSSISQNPSSPKIPKITLKTVIKSQTALATTSTTAPASTPATTGTTASASTAGFVIPSQYKQVWKSKELTQRDLCIPKGQNTHQTGSMLWKKGDSNLDQLHDFYSLIFNNLNWYPKKNSQHLLKAEGNFKIYTYKAYQGQYSLTLTHNTDTTSKSYQQKNSMTSVSWGDAKQVIADNRHLGKYMYLYKSSNIQDPFIITIEHS